MKVESEEIRHFCPPGRRYDETALRRAAGSYRYLCALGGHTVFTHHPIGVVLHVVR